MSIILPFCPLKPAPCNLKLSYLRTSLCTTYFAASYFAFQQKQFTIFP